MFSPYVEISTLTEFAVDHDDFDLDSLLTDFRLIAYFLTSKLGDAAELKDLNEWGDLSINRINSNLVRVLGHWAEQKQFLGECEVCKDWK